MNPDAIKQAAERLAELCGDLHDFAQQADDGSESQRLATLLEAGLGSVHQSYRRALAAAMDVVDESPGGHTLMAAERTIPDYDEHGGELGWRVEALEKQLAAANELLERVNAVVQEFNHDPCLSKDIRVHLAGHTPPGWISQKSALEAVRLVTRAKHFTHNVGPDLWTAIQRLQNRPDVAAALEGGGS